MFLFNLVSPGFHCIFSRFLNKVANTSLILSFVSDWLSTVRWALTSQMFRVKPTVLLTPLCFLVTSVNTQPQDQIDSMNTRRWFMKAFGEIFIRFLRSVLTFLLCTFYSFFCFNPFMALRYSSQQTRIYTWLHYIVLFVTFNAMVYLINRLKFGLNQVVFYFLWNLKTFKIFPTFFQ